MSDLSTTSPSRSIPIPLEAIREANTRIAPYIVKTPAHSFDYLSFLTKRNVLLKCENLQRTGSFKIRGASNCILENMAQAKKAGVVAASAGNHAQGVAMICHLLGIKAVIVMPTASPGTKIQNTQRWGAEVKLHGDAFDDSFDYAKKLADEKGYLFVHAYRDPYIMAGQGTIGIELCEDPAFKDIEALVLPVGGGGLATGIASAVRALRPDVKIYGVTPRNAAAAWKSFHKHQVIHEEVKFTLAEGTAMKRPDELMLSYLHAVLDDFFPLSEESIAHAVSVLAEHGKLVVEGSGALSVASLLEDMIPHKRVCVLLSGGNIDLPALSHVLHRGLVEQGRIVRLNITISDRPGGLHAATHVLAERRANILQVFHHRASLRAAFGQTEIEVDCETRGTEHTLEIMEALKENGFQVSRV